MLQQEQRTKPSQKVPQKSHNSIYPTVKRGEVYLCDFGIPYGSEQGYIRYAIVIQNNTGNLHSPTTIVLACTTEKKKDLPVHYSFTFSDENMIDYNPLVIGTEKNIVLGEQIRTIDKKRLKKYLGTMNTEFMKKIKNILNISLELE